MESDQFKRQITIPATATASTMNNNNNNNNNTAVPHPWSRLPAELKNAIYELALSSATPICISASADSPARNKTTIRYRLSRNRDNDPHIQPSAGDARPNAVATSLLRASKQTYREAAPMLYHQNDLHFLDPSAFAVFMRRLQGKRLLKCVQRITVPVANRRPGSRAIASDSRAAAEGWRILVKHGRAGGVARITLDTDGRFGDAKRELGLCDFYGRGFSKWLAVAGSGMEERRAAVQRVVRLEASAVRRDMVRAAGKDALPAPTDEEVAREVARLEAAFVEALFDYIGSSSDARVLLTEVDGRFPAYWPC
ncbi:hypothetical protein MPH_00234 [Macrophomina phaseolina MS6]|uniref:DUF7730 domain-containing protein n=1 Tax=Macrophomina phaseolina (strain MS6) TaxID=1126212 RepID=K2SJB7_MACPH|nr:hypothetical protein MPH_00234 [Macrophomina phaseolina MS6]